MEKIYMKYVNTDGDTCLVMTDDYDEIHIINMDKRTVSTVHPMSSFDEVLEEIDFSQDDLYVAADEYKGFMQYVFNSKDELDETLIGNLMKHTVALK